MITTSNKITPNTNLILKNQLTCANVPTTANGNKVTLTSDEMHVLNQAIYGTPDEYNIYKWQSDLIVVVHGKHSHSDMPYIKRMIKELAEMLKGTGITIRLAKNYQEANVSIYYGPPVSFMNTEFEYDHLTHNNLENKANQIVGVNARVCKFHYKPTHRHYNLRRLFMAILGFRGASAPGSNCSLQTWIPKKDKFYPLDEKFIKYLYQNKDFLYDKLGRKEAIESRMNHAELAYKRKIAEYFFDIAFGADYGPDTQYIRKWDKNIKLKITGTPTEEDTRIVKEMVETLNQLIAPGQIKISIVEDNANTTIFFNPIKTYYETGHFNMPEPQSTASIILNNNGTISRANIFIPSTDCDQKYRSRTIPEEITQILGLMRDSTRYPHSIFYEKGGVKFPGLYDIDKEIVKLLYQPELTPGMSRSNVEALFRKKGWID